jgi:hypothetical protein
MPVFKCTSCGRLLFRPEEFLGRAWQCPTCGPTGVTDEPYYVPPELADLLEQEYQVNLSAPPVVLANQLSGVRPPPRRRIQVDPRRGKRRVIAAVFAGIALAGCIIGLQALLPLSSAARFLLLTLFVALGVLALALLSALLVYAVTAKYRRRVLEAAQSHQGATSTPAGLKSETDRHVTRQEGSVCPVPAPKEPTHLQEKRGHIP